jgi:biofilm PGA synthesis protein PgaA
MHLRDNGTFKLALILGALMQHWPVLASTTDESRDWALKLREALVELERVPEKSSAKKNVWQAAMHLGLFEQAATLGAELDRQEARRMEGDQLALAIRYGLIDRDTLKGEQRFARLDAAIAATGQLEIDFLAGKTADVEDRRRLTDRLSALAYRRRSAEAVFLFEKMIALGFSVPMWAKQEVAGCYLELRQPNAAIALYRQVITENPENFEANLGLFFALSDADRLTEALQHIDAFANGLPVRRHRDGKYNGERLSAEITTDLARIYSDQLAEAETRLAEKIAQAPFNNELRQAQASLALARGWFQQGREWLRRAEGSDPGNPAIQAELSEASLGLQDWSGAKEFLSRGRALDAMHGAVRRAATSVELYDRHELYIDAGYGKGSSGTLGDRDWHIDTWLYSRPQAERWRLFFHSYRSLSHFDGDKTLWDRKGLGVEWRWLEWRFTAEMNGGSDEAAGLSTTARWKPNDYWSIYSSFENRTNDIPLKAVRDGVHARKVSFGVDWRAHESRKLSLGLVSSDFSDGNQRSALNLSWQERWLSGPRWSIETTLGADTSRNTLDSGFSYFNPESDRSVWLSTSADHLVWRAYEYAFRQKIAVTVGRYWQREDGIPAGDMQAIEYSHRWELDRDLSLRYGIGRSLRPYDGVREGRTFGNLTLLWRF